ncbi:MAG: hypothetical protein ACD_80C00016G0001 [uncultured bacterium (gcode 4)]|uniref:Prepilin-type N-terminal cleavage/methylation domain-containing protein n=1 Tax=uncultured bacterium (gcode 4) TaxID=1234023 RepID=K1YJQ2_9BACT|nr:MAG: hypothetical protein ACD_80C00016G0001 [uncultured bacterium (gcode 4)]
MKNKSAFTLIEVMIAITVFAIGVLAVLRLITQNLVTLDATQSRTMATFLAKEGMELVYNMRDSNINKWLPWDCILKTGFVIDAFGTIDPEQVCAWNFSSWNQNQVLQISFSSEWYTYTLPVVVWANFAALRNENRLWYATWDVWWHQIFWYSSRPVAEQDPTFFSRYILFTGVREWNTILPHTSIMKIESHVSYIKGTKTWEVILESFIWNR